MNLFKKLFRKEINPNTTLRKLEKIKIKIEKKIEKLNRLKEKKRVQEAAKKKIEEGIDKLKREREKIIGTIGNLTNHTNSITNDY